MTGFGTVETAIEAMKKGAYDYLLKPFKVEEVIHVVERALYRQRLQAENIRLREALTIYKVTEAIALSHDIEHILDVVLRAALDEVKADVATLHLRDPRTGSYEERVKIVASPTLERADGGLPSPAFDVLIEQFAQGVPILAHGGKAVAVLHRVASARRRAGVVRRGAAAGRAARWSACSTCSRSRRGKKFDEGHRKMLAVLASRAASAIDNARLYDELRTTNDELTQRQRLARGDVPADRRRLRAGARGERHVHARPLRARRRATPRSSRAASRCPTPRSAASSRPA